MLGLKFRRQHPLPPYVADFCCIDARLIVELDGSQHAEGVDLQRTRWLQARGFEVLRCWNTDVLARRDDVLARIVETARKRTLTPTPLPVGEGL